jgi:hypothetical protein
MKLDRKNLLSADLNTLFTRDPNTFFEAVLINILWDNRAPGGNIDQELVARQRFVFERWHKYFATNLRHDIEVELGLIKTKATADYQTGHVAGQIHALTNLPIKSGAFGKSVDLTAVTALLKKLKAVEPIGVITDGTKIS